MDTKKDQEVISDEAPTAMRHDPYAALRFRDFRLLLSGRFLSSFGEQMMSVAIQWQIYEQTRNPLALGYVGLTQVIPIFLFSLPAGHVADQFDRKKLTLLAQIVILIAELILLFTSIGSFSLVMIYSSLFMMSVARAFKNPASSTLLPLVVPSGAYASAVTWNTNAWQIAEIAGPALGGVLIAVTKSTLLVYGFAIFCSLVFIALIGLIEERKEFKPARSATPTFQSVLEGIRFITHTKIIFSVITLDLFAVLLGGAVALMPVYAKDILQVGPTGLGWMRAAPPVGALLTMLLVAHMPPFKRAGLAMLWSVAIFGAVTIVFGLSKSFTLSLIMLGLLGASDSISVMIRSTLFLLKTPDEMRGRVSAVNGIFISASNQLGALESGVAAYWLGPVVAVTAGGVGTILVVLFSAWKWPELVKLGRLTDEEKG